MGVSSSTSASKSPAWYPGEPSADVLSGHQCYYGEEPPHHQQSPFKGGGEDGTQFSITTMAEREGKRARGAAASTTTTSTALPSPPSTPSTPTAASEPVADGVGVGSSPSDPSSANRVVAIDLRAEEAKRVERDISALPVVELTGMKFIAQGAFCAVFACKYKGLRVVAKRVREDLPLSARRAALSNLWEEFECLRPLSHPNVIEAYGLCRVRCRRGYDDWNEKDVCLLLEELALGTVGHLFGTLHTVEKNLASAMARSRKMKMVPFRCRLDRILELALALQYLHGGSGRGVIMHRDIKSVNVGFAHNGSLKLMDFGLSKIAPSGSTEDDTYKMTGEVGSYRYMAPELVKHEPYNAKVDIYSWAILSWEILAIDRPYSWATETTFVTRVVNGGERLELHKSWPDRLCKLLELAWHADHVKRPTAAQLVAELVAIKAELPAKYRRQQPIVTAPNPAGDGGDGGRGTNRRHSWTPQASSSSLFDNGDRIQPPSGAVHHGDMTSKPHFRTADSLPLPAVTSSSSSSSSEKPRRWSIVSARRASSRGKSAPAVAEGGGGRGGAAGGGRARGGTQRPESAAGAQTRRRRSSGTSEVPVVESVAEEINDKNHKDRHRGSGRTGEAGAAPGTTATGNDGGRRWPLNRRRNSRQREIIVDALAREAEAATAGEEAPRAGQHRARNGGGGRPTAQRRRSGREVGEEGNQRSEKVVGENDSSSNAAVVAAGAAAAAAFNIQKLSQAQGPDSRVSSGPRSGPPREDQETSARVRRMPAQRPVADTRSDPVSVHARNETKHREQNETADRVVARKAGTKGGEGSGTVGRGTLEKDEDGGGLPLPSRRTSLLGTAVIEEEADEEDDEDSSGRSQGVHHHSSLDKLWPVLPTGRDAKEVPRPASFRSGAVRVAPKPTDKVAPPAARAGRVPSEHAGIFAILGTPSGVSNAEAIEERLALLRGTLTMPRVVSQD
eukprot:g6475.t1